jgi:tryptophan-rich sensory protein
MTKDSLKSFAALALILLVLEGVSGFIGQATMDGIQGWYQELNRSPLNPPGWVFGVVWPILYAVMGVSAWLVWKERDNHVTTPALMLFGLHMLVNWAWSFLFFHYHMVDVSFFWIVGLLALVGAIAFIFHGIRPLAAYLLIPYMGWLCFASYLSWYVWQNNPS